MEDHRSGLPSPESRRQICGRGQPRLLYVVNKEIHNHTLNALVIEVIWRGKKRKSLHLKQLAEPFSHSASHYASSQMFQTAHHSFPLRPPLLSETWVCYIRAEKERMYCAQRVQPRTGGGLPRGNWRTPEEALTACFSSLFLSVTEALHFQQKLDETTKLLRDLQEAQKERLSAKQPPNMICLMAPTSKEMELGKSLSVQRRTSNTSHLPLFLGWPLLMCLFMCAIAANSNYHYLCLHGTYEATASPVGKLSINTVNTEKRQALTVSSKAHSLPSHK